MKLTRLEYNKPSECTNFWEWLWFTADYPAGFLYGDGQWFKYAGSDVRVFLRRRFGVFTEYAYNREEFGLLHFLLFGVAVMGFTLLCLEVFLIWE